DVLVPLQRVDVRAALEQQSRGVHVAEETGQPERMEAVVSELVGAGGIVVEQLAQPLRVPERRRLVNGQCRAGGKQLVDPILPAPVEGIEQLCHLVLLVRYYLVRLTK